jgi:hypothetical protein
MAKRSMKKALGASLKAEEQAVKNRLKTKTVGRKKVKRLAKAKTVRAPKARAARSEETVQVMADGSSSYSEDQMISRIKRRCLKAGIRVKRSEVTRAGVAAIDAMNDSDLESLFESTRRSTASRSRRETRVTVVRRAGGIKRPSPLHINHFQIARSVVIGNKIVTITVVKPNLVSF